MRSGHRVIGSSGHRKKDDLLREFDKASLIGLLQFVLGILVLIFLVSGALHSQEIRRPSADADPGTATSCSGSSLPSTSGAQAYNAGTPPETTTSVTYASGLSASTQQKARKFTAWASASGVYSALTVNMNASCTDDTVTGGDCFIDYSTNGGSAWTTLKSDNSSGGFAQATFTATLSAGQNLANLQVRACADGLGGSPPGSGSVVLFDIWSSGTLATPAAPTGLTVVAAPNGTSNTLSWTDNGGANETGYQVNKCTGVACTPASYVTGLAANLTGYLDASGVSAGNTYGYQACAVNSTVVSCSGTVYVTDTAPSGGSRKRVISTQEKDPAVAGSFSNFSTG